MSGVSVDELRRVSGLLHRKSRELKDRAIKDCVESGDDVVLESRFRRAAELTYAANYLRRLSEEE